MKLQLILIAGSALMVVMMGVATILAAFSFNFLAMILGAFGTVGWIVAALVGGYLFREEIRGPE